jgi:hypothetical protein
MRRAPGVSFVVTTLVGFFGLALLLTAVRGQRPNDPAASSPQVTRVTATPSVTAVPLVPLLATLTPTATPLPTVAPASPAGTIAPLPTTPPTLTATAEPIPMLPAAEQTITAISLSPTSAHTPTPRSLPGPAINGIPAADIAVMPPAVAANIHQIYLQGQTLGRNPHAFSKLGSSLIATSHFLVGFDTRPYNLGDYAYLQPAVDHFDNSFLRYGVAIRVGLHTTSVLDPLLANKRWCQPNEEMVSCEIRLYNPAVLLILLGTNDTGSEVAFERSLRDIVELSISSGVIPVLVTKADRFEGPDNRNNNIMRAIAADYLIPLCDFDLVAGTLPGRGLGSDNVHLTLFPSLDYTRPEALQQGYSSLNLAVLMTLDAIRQVMVAES